MKTNPDDTAARTTQLPRMTQAFGTKVKASSNVADSIDRVDQGQPKTGVGITSAKPLGAGRHRGY